MVRFAYLCACNVSAQTVDCCKTKPFYYCKKEVKILKHRVQICRMLIASIGERVFNRNAVVDVTFDFANIDL